MHASAAVPYGHRRAYDLFRLALVVGASYLVLRRLWRRAPARRCPPPFAPRPHPFGSFTTASLVEPCCLTASSRFRAFHLVTTVFS